MDTKQIRVLLIEDNSEDVGIVKKMFSEANTIGYAEPVSFNLINVESLESALSALAVEHFDVILVDLALPDSRGVETFKRVYYAVPNLPIIVFSGQTDENVALQAIHEGAQDYILKDSVNSQILTRSIRYAIERKFVDIRIEQLVHYDMLTGLTNRVQLTLGIKRAIEMAYRYGWQIAVLFLDLDQFRLINDTLGHKTGDNVVKEVANRLIKIRASDIVARLGGDEFVLVINKMEDSTVVIKVAERILTLLKEPVIVDDHKLFVTGSIGISLYPKNGEDEHTLLKNADIAMYRAKQLGRNNYQFCTEEMTRRIHEKVNLDSELHQALDQQKFVLFYQPQIDLKTGMISGVEALVRMIRSDGTLMPPAEFIPVAEETGLIIPLGEWVLEAACARKTKWQAPEFHNLMMSIAINLSSRQLKEANLAKTIKKIVENTNLDPKNIELEITETAMMQDMQRSITVLEELRAMGIRIALDDFGIGFSSLSYLRQFPIDTLKLDQSFLLNIPQNKNDSAIVVAIIAMVHAMGISIIAEGVETREQALFLSQHQCDKIQGFYFSVPLPEDEMTTLIKQKRRWEFNKASK